MSEPVLDRSWEDDLEERGHSSLFSIKEETETTLPHLLEKYAAVYNKNGRVGIYTKEVSLSRTCSLSEFL